MKNAAEAMSVARDGSLHSLVGACLARTAPLFNFGAAGIPKHGGVHVQQQGNESIR
jgi:hypothetical protein